MRLARERDVVDNRPMHVPAAFIIPTSRHWRWR